MDSIIETLVQAGYFRARIKTLSDFDKIIGGMAWAMQVFSYDLDINIFYTDTLDLGEKIALTERLVMVLLVMNCPHQLEPHQIVGLDYANLLPVVCWLVRKASEVRQEHEAFNRLLALRHFFRVTNGLQMRNKDSYFCIPATHLSKIKSYREPSTSKQFPSIRKDETPLSDESIIATASLLDKLEENFGLNKQVSFLKLPSLMRTSKSSGTNDKVDHEDDEVESTDDDEPEMYESSGSKVIDSGNDNSTTNQNVHYNKDNLDLDNEETRMAHRELDTELLATNQKILNLLKKLDSTPNDLEIDQYQKRYIELHQQLISKNKHLKKLFALFNSLDSTKHYLTKEINLLDSIFENLDLTNDSSENRFQFLKQFQDIIVKIQNVKDDVVARLELVKQKYDALNAEYSSLSD